MLISKFNTDVPNLSDMIESEYSISLPDEYKLFLNKYNGGYTPKTKFKIGRISSDIKGFYGVGNVKLSLSNLNVKDWIDVGLFPSVLPVPPETTHSFSSAESIYPQISSQLPP